MVRQKMTKKILAEDPKSHVLMGLGRLTLGWDPANDRFLVKVNNIPHEELEKLVKDVRICRQKVVNTAKGEVR